MSDTNPLAGDPGLRAMQDAMYAELRDELESAALPWTIDTRMIATTFAAQIAHMIGEGLEQEIHPGVILAGLATYLGYVVERSAHDHEVEVDE